MNQTANLQVIGRPTLTTEPRPPPNHLNGMYHQQIEEVADIEKSYQWIENAGLKESTGALIMASQSNRGQVYHIRQDPRGRLCKKASETVQHIVTGCKMQTGMEYMECHDKVAGIVYRNICVEYGSEVPKSK